MNLSSIILRGVAITFFSVGVHSQQAMVPAVTAEAIMARVAANQDLAEAERAHYVYLQHAHVVSRKGKSVMCEETTESRITPSAIGSEEELLKLDGRLLKKHGYLLYTALAPTKNNEDSDTDRDLVESLRSGLIHDKSKDGLAAGLFPLTTKSQSDYVYHLVGQERINGREVFHVDFHPAEKDDFGWKGDAYIDTATFQPVVIRTAMGRKIPFAVRTLLGTSLPGLGFTVVYAPQPDGVWFPVSFGTEFKLHLVFFFNRQIILDAQSSHFEKTHVSSKIVESDAPVLHP